MLIPSAMRIPDTAWLETQSSLKLLPKLVGTGLSTSYCAHCG